MRVWPTDRETLVLPVSAREVTERLRTATQPPPKRDVLFTPYQADYLFNGRVSEQTFQLSRKITRPNNFLPLVDGAIEATSQGCLVFVRYRLFTATIIFLTFWSVMTTGFAVYLAMHEQLYHYAALSLGVGIINYAVAVLNFRKQVVISRRVIREVLS